MKKIILLYSILLLLPSCQNEVGNLRGKDCIDIEIQDYRNNSGFLVSEICNYQEKILKYVMNMERKKVSAFYNVIQYEGRHQQENLGTYILKNVNLDRFLYTEKLQLYYILKQHYGYDDIHIENLIGNIKKEHKNIVLPLGHIILGENLLTTDYRDVQNGESEGGYSEGKLEYLRYEHIEYLSILFGEDPSRIENISLILSLEGAYFTLKDTESRALFIELLDKLLTDTGRKKRESDNVTLLIRKTMSLHDDNWCNYHSRLQIDINNNSVEDIEKAFTKKMKEQLKYPCDLYEKPSVEIIFTSVNDTSFEKLQQSYIINSLFNHNLVITADSFSSSEMLYNFVKYINRNTSINEISINITNQNIKIEEKLFLEILQNSRFRYALNLDFSDELEEIDILRKMEKSNIQIIGFNNYSRGLYFDDFYFRSPYDDKVFFEYKGKQAEFEIVEEKEIFNYWTGPGSENIPFEYGE